MESADALLEEKKLLSEAKYRNYMSNIDKALRNFEYSSEWADLISALGKLSKAISSNTQYQIIPRRIKISKRLAQCMHPALPSGVHLKALETYGVIFSKTGSERLATELFIYSAGLFPLLGYAAMNVRPALLGIYETFFVPLGEKLRPALSGFLSGVLPGYENGLDHFDRTNSLLTQVCAAVNPLHFYTVLWECVATNASIRLPAITYLLEHFNKRLGMQQQIFIMGHNRDIMMSGLCACLNDSVILVQRNTLEFLLLGFPMHTLYLQERDLIKLVTNGLNSVLRRDMSLNRRLYSWLLGSEVAKTTPSYETASIDGAPEETESYFERHSKQILIESLICTLKCSLESTPVDLKPYRIMESLLDKAVIGSAVLDHVLCDTIRAMSLCSGNEEVLKSANRLFGTFDPTYIWSFMTTMYEKSCTKPKNSGASHISSNADDSYHCVVGSGDPCLIEICFLTEFLLRTLSLETYKETTRVCLPKVFLAITQMLTIHVESMQCDEIYASLKLCMKIRSRVPPMINSPIKFVPRTVNQGYASSEDKTAKSAAKNHAVGSIVNALEKSKSDSKLNQFNAGHAATAFGLDAKDTISCTSNEEPMRRSNSNMHMERKSPTKKKKAKSYSKLSELDKEIYPDADPLLEMQQSSSDLDTPLSIKKLKSKAKTRISGSPKKSRPKDMMITSLEPKSLDPSLLKNMDETDDQPRSAPAENLSNAHTEEFTFEYQEPNDTSNAEEFSILEKCIRQYEIFYEVYLARKVLQIGRTTTTLMKTTVDGAQCTINVQSEKESVLNVENILRNEQVHDDVCPERLLEVEKLFETLCINVVCRSKQLQSLLSRSLINSPLNAAVDSGSNYSDGEYIECISNVEQLEEQTPQRNYEAGIEQRVQALIDLRLSSSLRSAVKLASNLLVEMSTFPNCNKNITLHGIERDLPSWLKVLCLVACYTQGDKELQLSAITTLFDLISLLKSQIEHTTSPGVTFVVMLPLLKFGHVNYIEDNTRVFQLLTSTLWNYLGEPTNDSSQITSLLYQLHNCLKSGLVESVIGNRMYSHTLQQQFAAVDALTACSPRQQALSSYCYDRAADIKLLCVSPAQSVERAALDTLQESEAKSFKKFELLWHLGRDKQPSKGFEKTLLKVLDTLGLPQYMSSRTFVTKWLQSSLLRGDLSRLINPLYKILLAPNSNRIGVLHWQLVLQKEAVGDDDAATAVGTLDFQEGVTKDGIGEGGVYAISSEDGHIKYYRNEAHNNKKRSPIRSFQKKLFGVSLSSKNKTSNFVSDKTPPPAAIANEATQEALIGLIINPLDNSTDFDDEPMTEEQEEEQLKHSYAHLEQDEKELDDKEAEHDYDHDITDDSDSSAYDSESETRETSVEKDDSLTISSSAGAITLKRFVGDCERVTDMLSQHERTKNRKTYRLTREKTPADSNLASASEELAGTPLSQNAAALNAGDEEAAHVADEYFSVDSGNINTPDTSSLQNSNKDLMEQSRISNETPPAAPPHSKKKQRRLHSSKKSALASLKKSASSSDKKRMSCISKTSTDSNNSYGDAGVLGTDSLPEVPVTDSAHSEEEDLCAAITLIETAKATTINVEDKRRNLSLETSKQKSGEWELTQETLEKSKQNVQILRQNVAQSTSNGSEHSKRSSTKSAHSSGEDSRKLHAEKLNLFHNHMLIYFGVYDTKQTLYAFQTLRNIIACDTRTFLCLSITTSLASGSLKQLLIRHRKSIAGKHFAGSISNTDFSQSCMYLELLVTICLYYARGFFHRESNDGRTSETPTLDDVLGNCRVQLESVELLTLICSELIDIVKGMGKRLACYIADLMARCKLQKVILHCLNSSVGAYRKQFGDDKLAEQILSFNDPQDEHLHAESLQVQLLRLLMAVIKLEYEVMLLKSDVVAPNKADDSGNISPTRLCNITAETAAINVKYLPNCLISQQPMFLAAVLSALQDTRLRHLHRNWTDLVTASLNCFTFGSLTNIVISVVHQLCSNIDQIAQIPLREQCGFPPDYVVSQLEAITILCHYCLLDNTQQTTLSHLFNQAYPQTSCVSVHSSNPGQLLNNIVHSFLSTAAAAASSSTNAETQSPRSAQLLAARNAVLSHLSRIVASVAAIWDSELGQVRPVKQQLMEFLSPVSLHHGTNFLAAVAVTWQERGEQHRKRSSFELRSTRLSISEQYQRNSMLQACPEQLSLVNLVSSIRMMPMDSFVQTLHQVVKSPPPIHRPPVQLTIEVSALELFYFYMRGAPAPQLGDSWSSLLTLLRDGLSLTPPAQFALLMLLNEYMQRCPQMPLQDKKDIRDLHDVTSRLVDSLSNVAGSCLEQTTWLRRNLAVKEDLSPTTPDGNNRDCNVSGQQQYAVQAQSVLASILANLLDVAYGSQEKDKVVTIITTLLYNITPYLKNHSARNIPSFYACSSLLASLSGYQYTRKAWRKDMLDLLLDGSFFQMDISCLPFWKQIIDSLMTYDNTTFRELMSRVSLTQTGSLNIFTSREQEYEQRSMLLKRLAFVIYCSEFDQFHKYMPEIQEQLANSLRLLSMIPCVQAAVFLCFRVLLLRMSPDHVTSMWPIIIAEMVQVFLAIEQELKTESEELSNVLILHWRSVQLEASKLLELGCVLPATKLPHFQMYRWAFVGTEFDARDEMPIANGCVNPDTLPSSLYVPHIRRIARLMDMKYAVHSPTGDCKRGSHLALTCQQINSLQDLYGFFSTLTVTCPNPRNYADTGNEVASCLAEIEEVLSKDFLEKMATSTTPR